MAARPVFMPDIHRVGVVVHSVDFEWFPGFSVSQKQKSIRSLHDAAVAAGLPEPLEISTKSPSAVGAALSAFNLHLHSDGRWISLELAFQSSKIFQQHGPFPHFLDMKPRDAKREIAARDLGPLLGFRFEGFDWPLEPKTAFYDWLYLRALRDNPDATDQIHRYRAFTDIEFNPQRSFNCQAQSCALFLSISGLGLSFGDMSNPTDFLNVVSGNGDSNGLQHQLFD